MSADSVLKPCVSSGDASIRPPSPGRQDAHATHSP